MTVSSFYPFQSLLNMLSTKSPVCPWNQFRKVSRAGGEGQGRRFRTERAPKVLSGAFVELVLVHKQDVVLDTRVERRFETQVAYDGVVVAVDVGVESVEPLEELAQGGGKMLGKGDADARREGGFVVDVGLHLRHQVLDVFGG